MIKRLNDKVVHESLESRQIADHAGARVDGAAHGDIHQIVVAVAVGTCTFAIDALVLFLTQLRPGQTVSSSEMGANGEEGVHGMSEIVGPEARLFVKAQCRDRQMGTQASPDLTDDGLGGGQAALRLRHVKLRPRIVEETKIKLTSHLTADGVLHLGEVEHHAIRVEATGHRNDQLVVVTMPWSKSAGPEARCIVICGQFRQPVTVAGTETGAPCDDAATSAAMTFS